MKIIAYKNQNDVHLLFAAECGMELKDIADKDVPPGLPYVFIDDESQVESIDWTKPESVGLGPELFWSIDKS